MLSLNAFINEQVKLPSPTAIAIRILEVIRKDEDSFHELAEIIQSDPALTARILKVANSALYGLPLPVGSPAQAISIIGTQSLKNIALSFVVIDGFKGPAQGSFNLDLFWRRAITSAVAAETIADLVNAHDDDIFVTSLLQDFGVLILFLSLGPAYTEVLDNKRISGKELHEEELRHFGFQHAEVGSQILKTWNLPESIYEPIRLHHQHGPTSPTSHSTTATILNLADKIASIYHGTESNRKSIETHARLSELYSFNQEQSTELIDSIGEKALEVIQAFALSSGNMKPFSQIIQEANEELGRLNYSYEQLVLELTQAKQRAEKLALELKQANNSLRELALRDSLTALYNHRYFQDALEIEVHKSIRYTHDISLLLLDIDFFKDINDKHGHPTGDLVLKEISDLLVRLVRHCDIVARYGGEEFAIILPETGYAGAKVLAQRLRRGVEQHRIHSNDKQLSITVSIGVASSQANDSTDISRETLISRCDKALYAAKRSGRNRVETDEQNRSNTPARELAHTR